MSLNLIAVAREAAARWRQDRALLLPLAGLFLFVPQWTTLLLVPDMPALPPTPDQAQIAAWAEATQRWGGSFGLICIAAFLVAQLGQLAIVALYVDTGERSTVAGAIGRAARRLLRFFLAGLLVGMPVATVGLVAAAAPLALIAVIPAVIYVLGRTMLVGSALLGRHGVGAARAVALSWRWTRGAGMPLATLVGGALILISVTIQLVEGAVVALRHAGIANPVVVAALDAGAAAVAAGTMLALAMMQGVLYRRLGS